MTDSPMRAWWALAASIALILLAYVGDEIIAAALKEGTRNFSVAWPVTLGAIARVLAVALITGLGWLVFQGPRQRLVGAVMLVFGMYLALGQFLNIVVLGNTGIALWPDLIAYDGPAGLLVWTSAGVAVLGFVELVWPSKAPPEDGSR